MHLWREEFQQKRVLPNEPLLQRRPMRGGSLWINVSLSVNLLSIVCEKRTFDRAFCSYCILCSFKFLLNFLMIKTLICFFFFCCCSCQCPAGYNGPRCQQTARSFRGNGWAWYPALEMCDNSHLSFEFITRKADGLLLYNGPIVPPEPDEIMVSGKACSTSMYNMTINGILILTWILYVV